MGSERTKSIFAQTRANALANSGVACSSSISLTLQLDSGKDDGEERGDWAEMSVCVREVSYEGLFWFFGLPFAQCALTLSLRRFG